MDDRPTPKPTPEANDEDPRSQGGDGVAGVGGSPRSRPLSAESESVHEDFTRWLQDHSGSAASDRSDTAMALSRSPVEEELAEPALPKTVEEQYEDRGIIGQGGMGSVRRVFDRRLRREAALKLLRPGSGLRRRETLRFVDEAQITGQLDHPNIVPIHELGQDSQGSHFFTMKLVEGQNLERALEAAGERRLVPEVLAEFLQVFIKICDAVAFAHSRGVIHRDLKPSNIMVGDYGQVYVMDWGIARLVSPSGNESGAPHRVTLTRGDASDLDQQGSLVGTPRYMAPEQVQGQHHLTDERADVFALGATLSHILTGHAPYTEQNYFSLLVQVQSGEVPRPRDLPGGQAIPKELERIALKAMAKEPEDRYASALELKQDVDRFLRGASNLPHRTYPPGATIVAEGDEGDVAYILVEGRCRVLVTGPGGEQRQVREMGPGDVFGETAIFSTGRRSATVQAIDAVTVATVTSDALTQGLALNSWMGDFVRALAARFRDVEARLHRAESPERNES
ncbi:MAG: serine/threonine-protein kinase [Acidobacteriota bacterium]